MSCKVSSGFAPQAHQRGPAHRLPVMQTNNYFFSPTECVNDLLEFLPMSVEYSEENV